MVKSCKEFFEKPSKRCDYSHILYRNSEIHSCDYSQTLFLNSEIHSFDYSHTYLWVFKNGSNFSSMLNIKSQIDWRLRLGKKVKKEKEIQKEKKNSKISNWWLKIQKIVFFKKL